MQENLGEWASLSQNYVIPNLALQLMSLTYSVPMEELEAPTRRRAPVAFARQVAMYLVHVSLGISLSQVGRMFGRDRSTASHACRIVEDKRDDQQFDRLIETLERTLRILVDLEHVRAPEGGQVRPLPKNLVQKIHHHSV